MTAILISTSSPVVSIGLFVEGSLSWEESREAPMRAGGAVLSLLEKALKACSVQLGDVPVFAADVGPGSFTGVRVGITIAKTLAYACGKMAAGISAFDLIGGGGPAAVPARKGSYLFRHDAASRPVEVGENDERLLAAAGYGAAFEEQSFPLPSRLPPPLSLVQLNPEELVPDYVLEPVISLPKKPYPRVSE